MYQSPSSPPHTGHHHPHLTLVTIIPISHWSPSSPPHTGHHHPHLTLVTIIPTSHWSPSSPPHTGHHHPHLTLVTIIPTSHWSPPSPPHTGKLYSTPHYCPRILLLAPLHSGPQWWGPFTVVCASWSNTPRPLQCWRRRTTTTLLPSRDLLSTWSSMVAGMPISRYKLTVCTYERMLCKNEWAPHSQCTQQGGQWVSLSLQPPDLHSLSDVLTTSSAAEKESTLKYMKSCLLALVDRWGLL